MGTTESAVYKLRKAAIASLEDEGISELRPAGLSTRGRCRRVSMLVRLRPAPVLARRRFALWASAGHIGISRTG